jgi:hypothetical protein
VWSKNAVGRPGNGVSDHAKLNSPTPTPSHGLAAINDSVFDQMFSRELGPSCSDNRASPPNTWWLACAHNDSPLKNTR